MGDTAERLWQVVEPYVAAEGVELDDIEVTQRVVWNVANARLEASGLPSSRVLALRGDVRAVSDRAHAVQVGTTGEDDECYSVADEHNFANEKVAKLKRKLWVDEIVDISFERKAYR